MTLPAVRTAACSVPRLNASPNSTKRLVFNFAAFKEPANVLRAKVRFLQSQLSGSGQCRRDVGIERSIAQREDVFDGRVPEGLARPRSARGGLLSTFKSFE